MDRRSPFLLRLATPLALGLLLAVPALEAQQSQRLDMTEYPRPIEAVDNVWIEELTMLEVRDALRAGMTNVLILAGGVEENGPYLTTGKHNHVLKVMGESIARRMGNTLVAPILTIEPGNPAGQTHPGSIRLSQETYRAMLRDVATSLKANGFRNIFMMGDSGGNQAGQREVAEELSAAWATEGVGVHYIPEYYSYGEILRYQNEEMGVAETQYSEGFHDNYYITTMILLDDPRHVRFEERVRAGKASINGISLVPLEKSLWHGRQLVDYRTALTVEGMRRALAGTASNRER
jgi:creatinine amidohydrolase